VLSLVEITRAAGILERRLRGQRLQAAVQPDRTTLVLEFYGSTGDAPAARTHIVLSGHPQSGRVGERSTLPGGGGPPPAFAQFVRANLVGGRVGGVRKPGEDRELAIRIRTPEGDFDLLLSLFGRRSNLYVLDGQARIVVAMRPLAETRNELSLGGPWASPATPPRVAGEDRFAGLDDAVWLAAIEAEYAQVEETTARSERARRIEQALRKQAKTLDRKLEKLESELADAERATHFERHGELLKSVLGTLEKGDREARVQDWDSGEEVVIALDPLLTPAENLERLFKRYRKAVRTLTKGGAQLGEVQSSRAALAAIEADFAALADEEDAAALADFEQRADVAKLLGKYGPGRAPAKRGARPRTQKLAGREVEPKLVPRRYRTESGLEVWVGRSDAANDFLTVKLARGKDLFFHLDGAPGSHVILRTEGRDDPPSEAVLDACELAVHFSKQKHASRADVHVVPIKNVRKPKGAKPGLVMVHGGKSVHLRRTPGRLERILAAKLED
jgi:predicted ribosome quality control (RQC) complex YloA/Tae2 family protein